MPQLKCGVQLRVLSLRDLRGRGGSLLRARLVAQKMPSTVLARGTHVSQARRTHAAMSHTWGGAAAVHEIVVQEVLAGAQRHDEGNGSPMRALERVLMGPPSAVALVNRVARHLQMFSIAVGVLQCAHLLTTFGAMDSCQYLKLPSCSAIAAKRASQAVGRAGAEPNANNDGVVMRDTGDRREQSPQLEQE